MKKIVVFVLILLTITVWVSKSSEEIIGATYPIVHYSNSRNEYETIDTYDYRRISKNDSSYTAEYVELAHIAAYSSYNPYSASAAINGSFQRYMVNDSMDMHDIYMFIVRERSTLSIGLGGRNGSNISPVKLYLYEEFFVQENPYSTVDPFTSYYTQWHDYLGKNILVSNTAYTTSKSISKVLNPGVYYIDLSNTSTSNINYDYNLTISVTKTSAQTTGYFDSNVIKSRTYGSTQLPTNKVVHLKLQQTDQITHFMYNSSQRLPVSGYNDLMDAYENIYNYQFVDRVYGIGGQPEQAYILNTDHLVIYDLNEWMNFHFYVYTLWVKLNGYISYNNAWMNLLNYGVEFGIDKLIGLVPGLGTAISIMDKANTIAGFFSNGDTLDLSVITGRKGTAMGNLSWFLPNSTDNQDSFNAFMDRLIFTNSAYSQYKSYFSFDDTNYGMYEDFIESYYENVNIDWFLGELAFMLKDFMMEKTQLGHYIDSKMFYAYQISINKEFVGYDGPYNYYMRPISSFEHGIYMVSSNNFSDPFNQLDLGALFNLARERGISYQVIKSATQSTGGSSGGGGGGSKFIEMIM